MGKGQNLGEFEQLVMLALIRLGSNAYGVTIRNEISERAEREVSLGAVYATLSRLERKGFVSSREGDPTPERGGRKKRYFQIEAPGERALNEAKTASDRMWAGIRPVEA